MNAFWLEHLQSVRRPAARALIPQLVDSNPLGYEPPTGPAKKGTLLEYCVAQKARHPTKVILTRVGEFYETYGVDSVLLVEHCGLNPMGNKAKAGCPVRNVQATLDGLTYMGFTVAIYEELVDINANQGPSARTRIKQRALAQVVSPGSPTYIHNMVLRPDDIEFGESRPYLGLMSTAQGLSTCEVYLDEKTMVVNERLTVEAAAALIDSRGTLEPVYVQGVGADSATARILPDHVVRLSGYDDSTFFLRVLREVAAAMEIPVEQFRVMRHDASSNGENGSEITRPRSLYTTTAGQIGLMPNGNVPDLVSHLLPAAHQAHSNRFLRRWLLTPPPYVMADNMRVLCGHLRYFEHGLPAAQPPPVGKLVTLLAARQCNVPLFRDIRNSVQGMLEMLGSANGDEDDDENDGRSLDLNGNKNKYRPLVRPLLELTSYESGIPSNVSALCQRSTAIIELIDGTLGQHDAFFGYGTTTLEVPAEGEEVQQLLRVEPDPVSVDPHGRVPTSFVKNNEAAYRNCVQADHCPEVKAAYSTVESSFAAFCAAVHQDFPAELDVVHDTINNVISLKSKGQGGTTKESGTSSISFIPQLDRNRKTIPRRFTTEKVANTLSAYVTATQSATQAVELALQRLSDAVYADVATVVQAAHWSVILQAASAHTSAALQKGWVLPTLAEAPGQPADAAFATLADDEETCGPMRLEGLIPYWLSRREAIPNDISLDGIFLLTAPNMSGKSTLLRAALVAALLANSGLLVPCLKQAWVPRFDNFFLRTASFDVPSEGKSAFGVEMDDMRVILRDASTRSLVMVDELGKGTSSRDGSALAGALLEHLDSLEVSGIFATHLHEIFQLPLQLRSVTRKRMGIRWEDADEQQVDGTKPGQPSWTFRVEDGVCTESLAMHTARRFGMPDSIVCRAEALAGSFDTLFRAQHTALTARGQISTAGTEKGMAEITAAPSPLRTTLLRLGEPQPPGTVPVEKPCSSVRGANVTSTDSIGSANDSYFLAKGIHRCDIPALTTTLRRISGTRNGMVVEPGYEPPVSLEGRACVYVLVLHGQGSASDRVYVGETESIRQRLKQHLGTYKGVKITALVTSSPNKSSARGTESLLIARLKAQGYNVEGGGGDEQHVLFGAGC